MKENKKQQYLTPMVERLEARVERGFEGSLAPTGSNEDPVVADLQSATTDYKDLKSALN